MWFHAGQMNQSSYNIIHDHFPMQDKLKPVLLSYPEGVIQGVNFGIGIFEPGRFKEASA